MDDSIIKDQIKALKVKSNNIFNEILSGMENKQFKKVIKKHKNGEYAKILVC